MCAYGPGGQTEANTEMGLDPKLCLRERPSLLQRSDSPASCLFQKCEPEDFPGGPVVRTLHFHCREPGFDPWLGKIPQVK